MRPIPMALRRKMALNPFMAKCAYPDCFAAPEFEHAYIYSGRQINEEWAIVPVCIYHHRGEGLNKNFNRWVAISRATSTELLKYNKKNWLIEIEKLNAFFSNSYDIHSILEFDKRQNVE